MNLLKVIIDSKIANPTATTISLSPLKYSELMHEMLGLYSCDYWCTDYREIYGMKVEMKPTTGFCRNCGAPAELNVCSYCGTDSEFIDIK